MSCLWKNWSQRCRLLDFGSKQGSATCIHYRKENIMTKNFTGNCNYCHKKGHRESECCTKQNEDANNAEEEHALMTSYCTHKENAEMWIGDTGEKCHMKSSTEGMYDLEKCSDIKINRIHIIPHSRRKV